MAVYDWNNNGKKDVQDDFLEYNIYNESKNGDGVNDNSGCGALGWFAVIMILLGLLSKCGG